ncbi:ABC transporter ATP-binding protein [Haloimpatiens sp. FM7315]|uniref:ABC transporter ATP-binding protein n=1 Tax=Haloimpatiens sp. FM7315 TaxID=3298609 RepID=UPI0035A3B66C
MSLVLKTNCLTKKFGKQIAVNEVNMNIEKGDIYGFIGKNGAGKTTLMKMVCGLISKSKGEIKLFESNDVEKERKRIGCVIEEPAIYEGMTARQNLIYYNKLLGIPDNSNIEPLLKSVGLGDTGKKKAKQFSLGMKQRLSIAVALLGNPDFLILDEPINGLDPSGIREIRELIIKLNVENKITVLISSHILGEISKIATKYGIVDKGVLVDEFTAEELKNRCKRCLPIKTKDVEKAAYIIKNNIKSEDFEVLDSGEICVYDLLDKSAEINVELIKNNIIVTSISTKDKDAEEYFVKMMGGN